MTPPNTTPLNEELDKILDDFMYNATPVNLSYLKGRRDAKQELTNLIQTLEKKAYDKGYSDCVDSLGRPVNIPNTQLEKGTE